MTLLDSAPITACHECVATLTLPLARVCLLAETTVGGVMTVAFLRLTGGLTHGFLKFIAVTYAILAALAFLVVMAAPPGSYHRLLAINQSAAAALVFLQGLLVIVTVIQVVLTWRREDAPIRSWVPTLVASLLLLAGIVATLGPLAGSPLDGAAIAVAVVLSAAVLGAATTGLLYLAMIAILPGQLLGQLLLFVVASA